MKTYNYKGVLYKDLNSLGLSFANDFNSGLEVIKDKKFISFIKKFKTHRQKIINVLYNTRYLQNCLSLLINIMTDDKLIIIGGKKYDSFKEICEDINNELIQLFIADNCLSKTTLFDELDEKTKSDILTLEKYSSDEFVLNYFLNYYNYDAVETIEAYLSSIFASSEERFKATHDVFSKDDFQNLLAHKYGLNSVMELRKATTPVFKAMSLVKEEFEETEVNSIFNDAFYLWILSNYKKYSCKGKRAKNLVKNIKKIKTSKEKNLILKNENIFNLYHEFVYLYSIGNIKVKNKKDESLDFILPYCNTYINSCFSEGKNLSVATNVVFENKEEYNLVKLQKSIKNHKNFSKWVIFFSILYVIYYACASFIPNLKPAILDTFGLLDILFIVGCAGALIGSIFILIKSSIANRKYNRLCKLNYYRNNETILTDKDIVYYEKLKNKELAYAKKIDRFYRFYGSITLSLLSLAISIIIVAILAKYGANINIGGKKLNEQALNILNNSYYYLFIPVGVCFLLGLLRHKKTAFSCWFAVIISIIIAAVLLLLF